MTGTTKTTFRGHELDLKAPWRRLRFTDALAEHGLWIRDEAELRAALNERGVDTHADKDWAQLVDHAFSHYVEPSLIEPTIVHDYPIEISPFARTTDDDETLTERFEYFVGGMELGNAFSEINDSEEQRERFRRQSELVERRAGGSGLRRGALVRDAADRRARARDRPAGDAADGARDDPRRDPLPGAEGPFVGGCRRAGGPAVPLHRRRGRAPRRRRGHAAAGLDVPGRRVDRARPSGATAGQRSRSSTRAAAAAAELFDSRAVAESAIRNLGLDETPQGLLDRARRRHAARAARSCGSRSRRRARKRRGATAQEAAEVATVLFNDRFAPQTTASVWEAAARRRGARLAEAGPEPRARASCWGRLRRRSRSCSSASSADDAVRHRRRSGPPTRRRPPAPRRRHDRAGVRRSRPPASGRVDASPTSSGSWPSRGTRSPSGATSWSVYLDSFRSVARPGRPPSRRRSSS